MSRIHFFTGLLITLALLSGCNNDNTPFLPASSGTVSGTISQKNFSFLESNINPSVIDGTTLAFQSQSVTLTAHAGDRFQQVVGDQHTIYFKTDYGLLSPDSCVLGPDGTCSITWTATVYPDMSPSGNAPYGYVGITAYTIGEEGFTDLNGNGTFDDGESFVDREEPFVDVNTNGVYDAGTDLVIDVPSANDPTGNDLVHDLGDGLFNGGGCTHSTLCSPRTTTYIYDQSYLDLVSNRVATYTVGGTINGVPTGETAVIHIDSSGENLTVTGTGSPVPFTFTTPIADGSTYTVTVTTPPASAPNCAATTTGSDTGTISGANVTSVNLTCAPNTYTVGGTINGIPNGETAVLQINGTDNLTVTGTGSPVSFTFATPVADGTAYTVSVLTPPASAPSCGPTTAGSDTGTVSGANVTSVNLTCVATYSVSVNVTGVTAAGGTVVFQNNGTDNLPVSADGTYTFATPIADGSSYTVTYSIQTGPVATCTASGGSDTGTISGGPATATFTCN